MDTTSTLTKISSLSKKVVPALLQSCNAARNALNYCMVSSGSTVSLCALDVSKAYDKVNHSALFVKLMKRQIPTALLRVLENWLSNS